MYFCILCPLVHLSAVAVLFILTITMMMMIVINVTFSTGINNTNIIKLELQQEKLAFWSEYQLNLNDDRLYTNTVANTNIDANTNTEIRIQLMIF